MLCNCENEWIFTHISWHCQSINQEYAYWFYLWEWLRGIRQLLWVWWLEDKHLVDSKKIANEMNLSCKWAWWSK